MQTALSAAAVRALRLLEPEKAHRAAIMALKAGLAPTDPEGWPNLPISLWGRHFAHPLGIAAGFDKDAEAVAPLLRLGVGFMEIGAVTPEPQPGNPKPRVFRLPEDSAVINRYGFNSAGHAVVSERLRQFRRYSRMAGGIVGVNLGMNKGASNPPEQYRLGVRAFASSADFLTINVSSPNTPGLRDLQQEEELVQIVAAARDELGRGAGKPALLVKLSPDLDNAGVETLVGQLTDGGAVDGWIVSNTTIARPAGLRNPAAKEGGGLSGAPLRQRSTELVSIVYRASGGVPVIGAGGVDSGEAAYEKIKAGASLVQVYTSLIYNGPLHLAVIARGLAACLARDGISRLSDAIGRNHR